MSYSSQSGSGNGPKTEILYQDLKIVEQESSVEVPMSEWSSLAQVNEEAYQADRAKGKGNLYHEHQSYNASDEICAKYIAVSDSGVNVLRFFPSVKDPGIKKALFEPEPQVYYADDGQNLYLALCKEIHACPCRMFYKGLLKSEIDLSYYGINPMGVRAMTIALQYNTIVESLNLTDNFLNDDACYHLGHMLFVNSTLQELNLEGCRIGFPGLVRLGKYLHFNRTLAILNLARNDIGEDGGCEIAKILMRGANMKRLNLSNNGLSRLAAFELAEVLSYKDNLTHLDFSLNQFFYPASIAKMLNSLTLSSNLQELNLAWNALEGEKIAESIQNLMVVPTLTILDISSNRFTGEDVRTIASGLLKAKSLVTLDLSSNPLSQHDALVALEPMLFRRVKLQNLYLTNIPVNNQFLHLLQQIKTLEERKNFVVAYDTVLHNWAIKGPDARELVLRRADYLLTNHKRIKTDVVQFFLNLNKDRPQIIVKDMLDLTEDQDIPFDEGLIQEMALMFPGKSEKHPIINLDKLCDYVKRLWPAGKQKLGGTSKKTKKKVEN